MYMYFQEVIECLNEVTMTEGKVRGPCFKILYTFTNFKFFPNVNVTLHETGCRFKTYMALLYIITSSNSLYDRRDTGLIEILYRIM